MSLFISSTFKVVADPDLQIGGEVGEVGHPDPEIRGRGGLKQLFSALWANFIILATLMCQSSMKKRMQSGKAYVHEVGGSLLERGD